MKERLYRVSVDRYGRDVGPARITTGPGPLFVAIKSTERTMLLRLNGRMVDLRHGSVTDDAGRLITTLRRQTAETLKALAANPGEIVTKDKLMETVWGNIAVSEDSLVQCVIEIRKALGDDKHRIIRTLPKRGYVLETKAIDDGGNTTGLPLATHRRVSWIGLAAGLAVPVLGAAAYFWPIPEPDADYPAIAVLPVEKTNGDPAGKLDEMAARERVNVATLEEGLSRHAGRSTHSEATCKPRAVHERKLSAVSWRRAESLIPFAAPLTRPAHKHGALLT